MTKDTADHVAIKLHSTMDAAIWAAEFKKQYPGFDEHVMLGWFANAIMVGYDTAMNRAEQHFKTNQSRASGGGS